MDEDDLMVYSEKEGDMGVEYCMITDFTLGT
jgi:hypothetical protein